MQFSGGVGSYYGKLLRIDFLSRVLARLGFAVTTNGDTISASLKGLDRPAQEEALDQLGRLLASSRLLDVGIRSQEDIDRLTEAFFRGEYDYMNMGKAYALPGFYIPEGDWAWKTDSEGARLVQDGSRWASRFSLGLAKRLNRVMGAKYQHFLDNIQAYFYFPNYDADRSLAGYVGLWTKADSVTWFKDFGITKAGSDVRLDLFKDLKRTPTENS